MNKNSPFPSSGLPLCQNESKCETIHMKMCFSCTSIFMQIKLIFTWKVLTKTRFDTEENRNSEMGYLQLKLTKIVVENGSKKVSTPRYFYVP